MASLGSGLVAQSDRSDTLVGESLSDETLTNESIWSIMDGFIGRERELAILDGKLSKVRASRRGPAGQAVLIRGRRRVGKSRLVEQFVERADMPHVFFTAVGGNRDEDLVGFVQEITVSDLPEGASAADFADPTTWDAAFRVLASVLPQDSPSIVVIDELPYLVRDDPAFEGALQKAFDRTLSKLPVLLLLIGSDIAMMERLNTHGRPFYQRGTELIVPPLTPSDVASMLGLQAADAFDAYLVTGGLPLLLTEWDTGEGLWNYLERGLHDPTSALLVSGERTLAAEFPTEAQARSILSAIGHGERTYSLIARASGIGPNVLNRSLQLLVERRAVVARLPLSTRPSKETRYWIDDPYLRFWLSFVQPGIAQIERGRGDRVFETVRKQWTTWRGRAIEPVIRDALWRFADDEIAPGTNVVGGYWTRTNDPEIDLVGADREPIAKTLTFVGSIKWLENRPFDHRDATRLVVHRSQLPGATDETPLVAVSRSEASLDGLTIIGPDRLLTAWDE
ncbi:ATP-binding protein [Myceligenerans halotolerans]